MHKTGVHSCKTYGQDGHTWVESPDRRVLLLAKDKVTSKGRGYFCGLFSIEGLDGSAKAGNGRASDLGDPVQGSREGPNFVRDYGTLGAKVVERGDLRGRGMVETHEGRGEALMGGGEDNRAGLKGTARPRTSRGRFPKAEERFLSWNSLGSTTLLW